jgi:glucokinase
MGCEPSKLAAQALAGDARAISYWHQYGRYLGAGLANLIYILTPEAIILGGGISAGADLFLPSVWTEIEARVLPSSREGLQILVAELANQAGVAGAACLALELLAQRPVT